MSGVLIDPASIYDDDVLLSALELSPAVLRRARCSGELRHTRKGKRTLYLGQWVIDWLLGEQATKGTTAA